MNNLISDVKNDAIYKFGINLGFFTGFLLFASVLYFILSFTKKLPSSIKYYNVFSFVVIACFIGYAFLKLRK